VFAQDSINTGEGFQALLFPGNGGVELGTGDNRTSLSSNLPLSFTFEGWVQLPSTSADGLYKSIVSRYDSGADGSYGNRHADFVLQVQASGSLSFFMGNGKNDSNYGLLITATQFRSSVWSHVAFTVNTPLGAVNPSVVQLYYDLVQWNATWGDGVRQIPSPTRGRNIFLGDYFNQDGNHLWWKGYMDEVRFWSGVRTQAQLAQYRQRVPAYNTPALLAYYRFNDGTGLTLSDSTPNKYDGRLSRVTAFTSPPLWKVSGAKINVDVHVEPDTATTFFLPGFAPNGSLSFTYVIGDLPSGGQLFSNGVQVNTSVTPLLTNQVMYRASSTSGTTDSFTYFGTCNIFNPSAREKTSTSVFVQVGDAPCIPDACGNCGGDNSTCTCYPLPYSGYNLAELEKIIALYELEQSYDLISALSRNLENSTLNATIQPALAYQPLIRQLQIFTKDCLEVLCDKLTGYLSSYLTFPLVISS
jgi:hypothetical protein